MKRCPKCASQYSDQTLSFCLQDGTPLVGDGRQSSVDTIAFGQPVTAEKILPTRANIDLGQQFEQPRENYRPAQYAARAPFVSRRPKRSNVFLKVGMVVVPLLLIVAATGVGGWLYVSSHRQAYASEKPVSTAPAFDAPVNSLQRSPDLTASNKVPAVNTTTSKVDAEGIRKDIAGIVNAWKAAAETCNVPDYANRYGEKVEYFDRHGVTANEIKSDLQKICDGHSTIAINVDNMVVAVDAEGDAATAIFDKEWRYEASPKLAQGKAHVKLHFRKVGDDWKIVSETNLKTYYTKN